MKHKVIYLLISALLLIAGCDGKNEYARIIGFRFAPDIPVPPDTDVLITAEVEGRELSFQWNISKGSLRKVDCRRAENSGMPEIAVTPAAIDDVANILDKLGLNYTEVPVTIIKNGAELDEYDVLFINSEEDIDISGIGSILYWWVAQGGRLYLSGHAAEIINHVWPGKLTFASPDPYIGSTNVPGEFISANVLNPSIKSLLSNSQVDIAYRISGWAPIIHTGEGVETLLTADVSSLINMEKITNLLPGQTLEEMPVAVTFSQNQGKVLYTNFHYSSSGITINERKILEQFAAILIANPLVKQNKSLIHTAGFLSDSDYVRLVHENDESIISVEMTEPGDVFLALNAPVGTISLKVSEPIEPDYKVSGAPALTASFTNIPASSWKVSAECNDSKGNLVIPIALSFGTRTETPLLVTSEPQVIWHSPDQPGEYLLTLKIVDIYGRTDKTSIMVKVK